MDERRIVAKRIEELRTSRGMTQPEFAAALGMQGKRGRSMVNNWEQGAVQVKSDDLTRISKTFGVSADWLLGLSYTPNPDIQQQAIQRYTGLGPEAVERLSYTGMPRLRKTLDQLLSAKRLPSLLEALQAVEKRVVDARDDVDDAKDIESTRLSASNSRRAIECKKKMLKNAVLNFAMEAYDLCKNLYCVEEIEKKLEDAIAEKEQEAKRND